MKIGCAVLLTIMIASSNSDVPKLGSDGDPIRQGLFACQPLNVSVQRLKLDGKPGPFQTMADAADLVNSGKKEDAKSRLRSILALPKLETRIQLWVWSALRELGEQPDTKTGREVLGVVIEVPIRGAYDTLAAYQDGSARYLNFSGSAIFWDTPDPTVQSLSRAFIASAASTSSQAKPRKDNSLPKSGTQVTLLTRAGMFAIADPPPALMKAASALVVELIYRAGDKKT